MAGMESVQVATTPPTAEIPRRPSLPAYMPHTSRRKVTLACNACRQRRTKCTGTRPCAYCTANQRPCVFDSATTRARRGPRPRASNGPVARNYCQLAPTLSHSLVSGNTSTSAVPAAPADSTPVAAPDDNPAESEDESDGPDDAAGAFPPLSTWKPNLETLLAEERGKTSDVDIVCHSIDLFWCRSSADLRLMLPPKDFIRQLQQGLCSKALIFALCACHLRYSVHAALKGLGIESRFQSRARELIEASDKTQVNTSLVQSLCFLIEHAAHQGDGNRAWIDIAIAKSLVQLNRMSQNLSHGDVLILDRAEHYLVVAELLHCIGHPALYPADKREGPGLQDAKDPEDLTTSESGAIRELLWLFLRIQKLCSTQLTKMNPPPWHPGSSFRVLQDDIESTLIRRPIRHQYTSSLPSDKAEPVLPILWTPEKITLALLWHTCVVVLYRGFLPIPQRRPDPDQAEPGSVKSINFPLAPGLFLEEKIRACEASAAAISRLCQEVVAISDFFRHARWVGYSCMQSAYVMINQLQRTSSPYDPTVVENLKFAFTVLGVYRKVFEPASEWIDTLLCIHDVRSTLKDTDNNREILFGNYFSRFNGVSEPPFVPIRQDRRGTSRSSGESPDAQRNEISTGNAGELQDTEARRTPNWAQIYAGHLARDILSGNEALETSSGPQKALDAPRMASIGRALSPRSSAESPDLVPDPILRENSVGEVPVEGDAIELAGATETSTSDASPGEAAPDVYLNSLDGAMDIHAGSSTPSQAFAQFLDLGNMRDGLNDGSWTAGIDQLLLDDSAWTNALTAWPLSFTTET